MDDAARAAAFDRTRVRDSSRGFCKDPWASNCGAGLRGEGDLLLTDCVLETTSGQELATSLQQARPGLKILLMSGCIDDDIERYLESDRRPAFLQKPFDD